MGNELLPAGEAYAYTLLEKYSEIIALSEENRQNILSGQLDKLMLFQYVSKLTRFWVELLPKIDGSEAKYGKAFVDEYKAFIDLYENPELPFLHLTSCKGSVERNKANGINCLGCVHTRRMNSLERVIRTALEKMKITAFER